MNMKVLLQILSGVLMVLGIIAAPLGLLLFLFFSTKIFIKIAFAGFICWMGFGWIFDILKNGEDHD